MRGQDKRGGGLAVKKVVPISRAIVSKSVKRLSDKNCGKNKKLEQSGEACAKPKLL